MILYIYIVYYNLISTFQNHGPNEFLLHVRPLKVEIEKNFILKSFQATLSLYIIKTLSELNIKNKIIKIITMNEETKYMQIYNSCKTLMTACIKMC